MILLNKTIRLFLDSIGRREEYEFYLSKFQSIDTPGFALVCPDGDVVRTAADMLVFDLQFLLQVGLVPVVILAGENAEDMLVHLSDHADRCRFLEPGHGQEPTDFVRETETEEKVPVLVFREDVYKVLAELVPDIARRVHFVRARGALRTAAGKTIYYYYTRRHNLCEPADEDRCVVAQAQRLLEARPSIHVSITSPLNVLGEIFTVKGAGSVIRKGRMILRCEGLGNLDRRQLLSLLGQSFDKKLVDDRFLGDVRYSYVEQEYRGAALLESQPAGDYLSKFAVGTEARGEGLAQELWQELDQNHPRLFWRSRESNPINHWYEKKAEGRQRTDGWLIFWRGVDPYRIAEIITYCKDRPADFIEVP